MTPTDPNDPTPARDAVLTLRELAAALKIKDTRTVQKMDLPYFMVGGRQRYIYGQVLDVLAQKATGLKRVA